MGRLTAVFIKWRDVSCWSGYLSHCLSSVSTGLYALQNEPQQGIVKKNRQRKDLWPSVGVSSNNRFFFSCLCGFQCVSVEHSPQQLDQESVEIDDFFDNSVTGSSFLFFNGEVWSSKKHLFIKFNLIVSQFLLFSLSFYILDQLRRLKYWSAHSIN